MTVERTAHDFKIHCIFRSNKQDRILKYTSNPNSCGELYLLYVVACCSTFNQMINKIPKYIGDLLARYDEGEREFGNCDFEKHENLQHLTLDDSNLQNSIFFSADFTGTSFRNCDLKNCGFKCCKFENVDFTNADLSGSLLSGAEFINCVFANTKLDEAEWYGHKITTEEFLNVINK
jgi:uncharacterized protein YjbI with pentapeptide repeats